MYNLLKNRLFVVIAITLILIVIMGVFSTADKAASHLNSIVSVPLTPVQSFFSFISLKFEEFISFFRDTRAIKDENRELTEKIKELEKENRELKIYMEKNIELREALNLKGRFDNYDLLGANVIAMDSGNWFNIFRVDIGRRDGVETDCPVLTGSKGLVGRVINPDLNSSKVLSIIDEDSVVSGWLAKADGGSVIIRGNLELSGRGLCRMDYIPLYVDVRVGDIVETSGLGGIYPKGIIVGSVIEVVDNENEFNRFAVIQPAVNFKRLEEVYILKKRG